MKGRLSRSFGLIGTMLSLLLLASCRQSNGTRTEHVPVYAAPEYDITVVHDDPYARLLTEFEALCLARPGDIAAALAIAGSRGYQPLMPEIVNGWLAKKEEGLQLLTAKGETVLCDVSNRQIPDGSGSSLSNRLAEFLGERFGSIDTTRVDPAYPDGGYMMDIEGTPNRVYSLEKAVGIVSPLSGDQQ